MAYEFIAIGEEEEFASYHTINQDSAHYLMGALGLDYDPDAYYGDGDEFFFTDAELSAAEAALTVAINPPVMATEGLVFLATLREEIKRKNLSGCSILIS